MDYNPKPNSKKNMGSGALTQDQPLYNVAEIRRNCEQVLSAIKGQQLALMFLEPQDFNNELTIKLFKSGVEFVNLMKVEATLKSGTYPSTTALDADMKAMFNYQKTMHQGDQETIRKIDELTSYYENIMRTLDLVDKPLVQ